MEMNQQLSGEIDTLLSAYDNPVEINDGLFFSLKDTIKRIQFYSLSQYLSGDKDGYGRRKPFKNIVNEHVDGEVTATDPDFKHLQLKAENQSHAMTLLLRKKLVEWAKKTGFSETLNELNETYVRYGGVIAKRTKRDGKMHIEAVAWKDVAVDQIDIASGAIVERHWLSPTELRAKKGQWENVEDAIDMASKDRSGMSQTHGSFAAGTTDRVEVLEIEGEFPMTYLDENADEDAYSQMRMFVATDGKDKILLDAFETTKSQYKYKARKSTLTSGRSLGMGVVEEGFDAQISTNEASISERLAFELGGKVIAKTNSQDIASQPLTSVEDGTVLELKAGEYFESMSLLPSNVPEYNNLIAGWEANYRNQTGVQSTTEAPKSGTAFRSLALQARRGAGKSDYRREGFGFLVKEILYDWVLPELAKEINKEHINEDSFTQQELKAIDSEFTIPQLTAQANDGLVEDILGGVESPLQPADVVVQEQAKLRETNRRKINFPKGAFKDIMKNVTVLFDDEFLDRQAQMQTLFDMWSSMAPEDPNRQLVWNEMVELGGALSPAQMVDTSQAQGKPQQTKESPITSEVESVLPKAQQ